MRLAMTDRVVLVTLSERNLAALLHKLTLGYDSARMLVSGDVYRDGLAIDGVMLAVRVETNDEYYSGRPGSAGETDPDTAAFIARIADEDGSIEAALHATLGPAGALLAMSKTHYERTHPDHTVVFNANVCASWGKLWHGDLDLERSEQALRDLANRLGETIYILHEADGRFENEARPLLERAVLIVEPDDRDTHGDVGLDDD
jgi:hypothetical protein